MKSQFLLKLAQKIQLTCRLPRSVSFGEKVDALLAGSSATSITDEQYISGESFSSKSLHDNSIRRNIILVASVNLPLFDQNSGALRLKNLIRLMSEAGWTIVFGSVYKRSKQPGLVSRRKGRKFYEDALRADGVSHFLYGMTEIESFLVQAGKELDWAFLSFPTIAARLISRVRSRCATARIAFDMVDFHALRLMREAALHNDHELQIEAERQREEELACVKSADVTFAVTQEEKALLSELVPEAVVEVLPNVFDIPRRTYVGPAGRKGILFVGGFLHKPNVDAICWFMDRIWPLILREEPDTFISVAGSSPSDEVLALGAQTGVEVLGFVPDLMPLYDRHRVAIAPLRYGAGMKGKVGQSLLCGLPMVATSIGAEGMGLLNETHLLISDDEAAFATNVRRLLHDDILWSNLSVDGRKHIEQTLSMDVVGKLLKKVLEV